MHHDPIVAQALVRLVQMIQLGRIKAVDTAGNVQTLQIDLGPRDENGSLSLIDGVPFFQQFGFASVPPADSEVLVACLNGERSAPIALGTNNQAHRPPAGLQPGDAAIYDLRGAYVRLTATGIVVDAAGRDVTVQNASGVFITAPAGTKVTGSLAVTENLTVGNGATGTFTTPTGQMVTVQDGIVTNID